MPKPVWSNKMENSRFNEDSRYSAIIKVSNRPLSPVSNSINMKVGYKSDDNEESYSNNRESVGEDSDNESIDSHFDAIDEISEIFSSSSSQRFSPMSSKFAPFQRPSNPIISDIKFSIPRCSAPRFNDLESEDSFELNNSFSQSSY